MPRKVRQLLADLRSADCQLDRQKEHHCQFKHFNSPTSSASPEPRATMPKHYQKRQVAEVIARTQSNR